MRTNLYHVRTTLRDQARADKKKAGTPMREGRQFSQQEIADILGIPRSRVSMIESGQALPTIRQIEQIAEFLGVTVGHLVTPKQIEFLKENS